MTTPEKQEPDLPTIIRTVTSTADPDFKKRLDSAFGVIALNGKLWLDKARTLVVTDESETEKIETAAAWLLEVKTVRLAAKSAHTELKSKILPLSQAIDSCERSIRNACEPVEEHLKKQVDFAKIREAEARRVRTLERTGELLALGINPLEYPTQMDQFTDEQWTQFVQGQQDAIAGRAERERVERERQEKQLREAAAESARIAKENRELRAALQSVKQAPGRLDPYPQPSWNTPPPTTTGDRSVEITTTEVPPIPVAIRAYEDAMIEMMLAGVSAEGGKVSRATLVRVLKFAFRSGYNQAGK